MFKMKNTMTAWCDQTVDVESDEEGIGLIVTEMGAMHGSKLYLSIKDIETLVHMLEWAARHKKDMDMEKK